MYVFVSIVDLHFKILDDPSPSLSDKSFSPEFCSFIDDCLQKDPVTRPTAEKVSMRRFNFLFYEIKLLNTGVSPCIIFGYRYYHFQI